MGASLSKKQNHAITLLEILVIMAVAAVLAAVFFWHRQPEAQATARATRIQCVNNLKQIGLAYRLWAGDHGEKYPMELFETNGGTIDFIAGPNAYRHFQVISNQLSTPNFFFCPDESDRSRTVGTNINLLRNANISYFVGVDASQSNVQMILSGDRNITNGTVVKNGMLALTPASPGGWTSEMHNKVGNILLADGSVQQLSLSGLQTAVENTGLATNRLQMPALGP